jgi:DNA polymerase-3 subunit gamma/tau
MDDRQSDNLAGGASGAAGQGAPEEPSLDLGPVPAKSGSTPYRVLARKYRPSSFEDLIGQEAMVRTLTNAFELGRIHQAYMLTGVRGVGKTTTARILARAFNYHLPAKDGRPEIDRPTIDMRELGSHCQAIIESRHVDVIEMDAASHTGVDDVRDIIEGVRYRPVTARCKVYIIDEVHMLTKNAFNALLKTLEEPPEHVRFLFATTEIEKVPVTVRSRCQRFDLRRVEADVLIKHLAGICEKEGVQINDRALALLARAAEGSVRDSLSLLDQAIAYGASSGAEMVNARAIRAMLGTGDRGRIIDLFEAVMKGDVASALENLKEQYDQGADPALVLTDLAEFVHFVTRLKVAPDMRFDASVTQDERTRGPQFASSLSMQTLTRAWQIVTKGLADVKTSPRPLAAADMVLVRLAYAADLPTPEDALRRLREMRMQDGSGNAAPSPRGGGGGATAASAQAMARPVLAASRAAPMDAPQARQQQETAARIQESSAPRVQVARFEDIVTLAQVNRDIQLRMALERDVHLVRFEQGAIEFALADGASPQVAANLMRRLQEWTGQRWMVAISSAEGAPTLLQQKRAKEEQELVGVRADPLVRSVLEHFPGAQIVSVRKPEAAVEAPAVAEGPTVSEDVAYDDAPAGDDDEIDF